MNAGIRILPKPEFGEPPAPTRGSDHSGFYAPVIVALRARPGEWARIGDTNNTHIARSIKDGKCGFGPAGEFEACTRRAPELEGPWRALWARYVGGLTRGETVAPAQTGVVTLNQPEDDIRAGLAEMLVHPDDPLCHKCRHPKRMHRDGEGKGVMCHRDGCYCQQQHP